MKTILKEKAQQLFEHLGYKELTSIQRLSYEKAHQKKDLIIQSATGSGKTHAFLFPLMDAIDTSKTFTQAVIIAPTRELAMQLYQFATEMKTVDEQLTIALVVGGQDRSESLIQSHIVIGTPGRLSAEFSSGQLLAQNAQTIIIDEADMIWEYGFMHDVAQILHRINKPRQMLVYSATIPDILLSFLKKEMNHPEVIVNKEKSDFNPKISHYLVQDVKKKPDQVILDLMKTTQMSGLIIFTNTREEASQLSNKLREYDLDILELHGDLSPRKRKQTLTRLFGQKHFILVASDIAARGLDLPYVSHVISVGLPSHLDFYFHRAGRSSRAGLQGYSIVLVNQEHRQDVLKLQSMGVSFEYKKINNNMLNDARNFFEKRTYHKKVDPQVTQILNRKTTKVKPNYKKKRKAEIASLERKKKREMIQKEISKQKKERAKARSKSDHS